MSARATNRLLTLTSSIPLAAGSEDFRAEDFLPTLCPFFFRGGIEVELRQTVFCQFLASSCLCDVENWKFKSQGLSAIQQDLSIVASRSHPSARERVP